MRIGDMDMGCLERNGFFRSEALDLRHFHEAAEFWSSLRLKPRPREYKVWLAQAAVAWIVMKAYNETFHPPNADHYIHHSQESALAECVDMAYYVLKRLADDDLPYLQLEPYNRDPQYPERVLTVDAVNVGSLACLKHEYGFAASILYDLSDAVKIGLSELDYYCPPQPNAPNIVPHETLPFAKVETAPTAPLRSIMSDRTVPEAVRSVDPDDDDYDTDSIDYVSEAESRSDIPMLKRIYEKMSRKVEEMTKVFSERDAVLLAEKLAIHQQLESAAQQEAADRHALELKLSQVPFKEDDAVLKQPDPESPAPVAPPHPRSPVPINEKGDSSPSQSDSSSSSTPMKPPKPLADEPKPPNTQPRLGKGLKSVVKGFKKAGKAAKTTYCCRKRCF